MKHFLITLAFIGMTLQATSQTPKYDTVALMILDRMTNVIGDLTSVSFTLNTRHDELDYDAGIVSRFGVHQVYFYGPDKMLVNSNTGNEHRGFWYNGTSLVYYSFNENNYAVIEAPKNTIATIDSVNFNYGIEFPAADFFYPTFINDLIGANDLILFHGMEIVEGKECFHLIAKGKEQSIQFWIANDAMNLPVKMLIMYNGQKLGMQYEATFSYWDINPELPVSIFNFTPPPKARQVSIIPKS